MFWHDDEGKESQLLDMLEGMLALDTKLQQSKRELISINFYSAQQEFLNCSKCNELLKDALYRRGIGYV